mgnify:CR=1 FL=1
MVSSKTNKRKKPDPIIVHCATLWSMVDHPSHSREWSLERKIKAVKDAGFDGVMWRPSGELKKLIKKYDLKLFGKIKWNGNIKINPSDRTLQWEI